VVEKDGSVGDVNVIRNLSPECDEEAIRVVKLFPKWTPGKQNGEVVRVQYVLPVQFALSGTPQKEEEKAADIVVGGSATFTQSNKDIKTTFQTGENSTLKITDKSINEALILIDDKEMPTGYDLQQIKPDDIKSIEVLKDESSTKIYGEKGKNGVIMITTKKRSDNNQDKIDAKMQLDLIKFVEDFVSNPKNNFALIPNLGITDPGLSVLLRQYNELIMQRERIADAYPSDASALKKLDDRLAIQRADIKSGISNARRR
jgi:TonB-dependent SusC/RagA subfamily outer membrane receptor